MNLAMPMMAVVLDPVAIGVGVVLLGVVGFNVYNATKKKNPGLQADGTDVVVPTPWAKLQALVQSLIANLKKDAALSEPNRIAITSTLILIQAASEQLPDEAQRNEAKAAITTLATIFVSPIVDEAPTA